MSGSLELFNLRLVIRIAIKQITKDDLSLKVSSSEVRAKLFKIIPPFSISLVSRLDTLKVVSYEVL